MTDELLDRFAAQLQLGDVVRFRRGELSHLALYVGHGKVIHLWSPTDRNFSVRIDTLRRVHLAQPSSGGAAHYHEYAVQPALPQCISHTLDVRMRADHQLSPFSGTEIVERARQRLGETEYDVLYHNCEHFVTWARYGFGASPQVTSHSNQVLAGALLGAVVGGIAGFLAGGLFSLLLKGDALSTSASIGSSAGAASGRRMELDASSSDEDNSDIDDIDDTEETRRANERAQLWVTLDAPRSSDAAQSDELRALDAWADAQQQQRTAAATPARPYSTARHRALATRLAEDDLLCGICFSDLVRVRAVAFACDHFTCSRCLDALRINADGNKCCPYCRVAVCDVDEIHATTKARAQAAIQQQQQQLATEAST